jgi:hypothetical protein
MGFPGDLTSIPSTFWLRNVGSFRLTALITAAPVSRFILLLFSIFHLIQDQLFAPRERLYGDVYENFLNPPLPLPCGNAPKNLSRCTRWH